MVGFQSVIDFTATEAPTRVFGDFDRTQIFHGSTSLVVHRTVPAEAQASIVQTIVGVDDKRTGALIRTEAVTSDAVTGQAYFTIGTDVFFRGFGGFGGARGLSSTLSYPDRDPDHRATYGTRPDQALLYRLSGDHSPHHSDPEYAKQTPIGKPFFQGLLTYGVVGRALLHTVCGSEPDFFDR